MDMSLSRRDFLKFGSASAAGVAVGARALDLAPVEAAATALKIKEAKAFHSVCPYCAVGCGQLIYAKDGKIVDIEGDPGPPAPTRGRRSPSSGWTTRSRSATTPRGRSTSSSGRRARTAARSR